MSAPDGEGPPRARDRPNSITATSMRTYRLARRLHRLRLRRAARAVTLAGRLVTKVVIDPTAQVPDEVMIAHGQGLVVGPGVRLGAWCLLHQGVTIAPTTEGAPVLGTGVFVYPGAVVLGPVTLGDGARVGANAVVLHDVAPGASAVGVDEGSARVWAQRPL